jgi:predicted MFS family arabinose efflux permease
MTANPALRRQLRLAGVSAFGAMAAMRACDPMLLTLASEFGRTVGEASRVVSVFAISYGVLQLVYGPLGDRVGKLRVVALASAGCAVAAALATAAPTLEALIICRALMGATAAGIIPLTMAWVGDTVAYEDRQETLARLLGATVSGMIAGQWLGAWITEAVGWRYAFALLTLVFIAAAWPLFRETSVAGEPRSSSGSPAAQKGLTNPLTLLRETRVRWVLCVAVIEGALVFGVLAFVPSHLAQQYGLRTSAAGAVLALYGVGGLLYGRLARRGLRALGERGLATAGGATLGLSLLLLSWSGHWLAALPACLFAGMGFYMLHATLQTQATQMAPSRRGAAVALFACALFFGQSIGVVAVSFAVDRGALAWAFSASAVAVILLGGFVGRGVAPRAAPTVSMP